MRKEYELTIPTAGERLIDQNWQRYKLEERPQRDSNPRFGLERATSWASGRWGLAERWRARTCAPEHQIITGRGAFRQTSPRRCRSRPGCCVDRMDHDSRGP